MALFNARDVLRRAGLRITAPRLAALAFFYEHPRPVELAEVAKHLRNTNLTTVYRMLEAFVAKGIVYAYDIGHGHRDYELASRPHHHHAVCTVCGKVEEVYACSDTDTTSITKAHHEIASFAKITHHHTTLFGVCKACV